MSCLSQTRSTAFSKFKELIGQNNHYLITILIGLDGVKNRLVTKNKDFSTTWDPVDIDSTVTRSRQFAIKATMAWLVDCLDTYYSLCNRKPKLIQDQSFLSNYSSADKSIYGKFHVFVEHLKINVPEVFLIDLTITWRNRLVHFLAKTPIKEEVRMALLSHKQYFVDNYQGLDIELTIQNFDNNLVPKFKEITAFIRAAIVLTEKMDYELIQKLSEETYYKEILSSYLDQGFSKRLGEVWSKDVTTKQKSLINIFRQYGMKLDVNHSEIVKYSSMSYKEAKEYFS